MLRSEKTNIGLKEALEINSRRHNLLVIEGLYSI